MIYIKSRFNLRLLFVVCCLTIIYFSCSKEKLIKTQQPSSTQSQEKSSSGTMQLSHENDPNIENELLKNSQTFNFSECRDIKGSVYKSNGVLVFQDIIHFDKCVACLDEDYEVYNDAYEAQYPNATAEELDSLDIINNFDEWGSYISFESSLHFSSLRAKIETEIVQWLENTPAATINFDDDPDLSVPIIDESVRALLNENGEVKIGKRIYTVDELEGGTETAQKWLWDDCGFATRTRIDFEQGDHPAINANRRLRVIAKVASGLGSSKLKGKMIFYRANDGWLGNWRRERATMRLQVWGRQHYGNQSANSNPPPDACAPAGSIWSKFASYKKRKRRKATSRIWGNWREALVEPSNADYAVNHSVVHAYFRNDNNYFPVFLERD